MNFKTYCIDKSLILSLFFIAFFSIGINAQNPLTNQNEVPFSNLDELRISVYINPTWDFDTNVKISRSEKVYVNVLDLFYNLKISCVASENGKKLTGFIINEKNSYSIDSNSNEITIGGKVFKTNNNLVLENGIFYIDTGLLSDVFGLNFIFNPRSLSATVTSNFELPYLKGKRIEMAHENISKLKQPEKMADSIISRTYNVFKFGTLDWSANSFQTENQSSTNNIRLGLGAELFFGEANVSVNYNDKYKFDSRQVQYNWRWIDNDKKYIKQVQLGRFSNNSISFLSAPLNGITINNSSTTVRKAKGYYTINDVTEPNWVVELYLNDVLINYTTADASGVYSFKVPNIYGYTKINLRFRGPLGEERFEERVMNVPYIFLPEKTFEYNMSAGILQDGQNSRFGKADFKYGLNHFITLGGGVEYLSSIPEKPFIPFANMAIQPFNRLVLNFEYAHDVRARGLLNYYFTKSAFLELEYTKYVEGQLATRFNALEERKLKLFYPIKINKISGFMRLNYNQLIYDPFNYNQIDYMLSASYKKISFNSSTVLNWVGVNSAFVNTFLSMSYRTNNNLVIRPSMGYAVTENDFINYRLEIEKRYNKMYFTASYQKNVFANSDNYLLSFKYDLPFALVNIAAFYNDRTLSLSQNVQGSMAFGGDHYTEVSNNSSVGRGGVLFYPFLDLNGNGIRDNGEKMVMLSTVNVSGGQAKISKKDLIVRVSGLNAFVNYNVEFINSDLESIAWRFKHNTYQVLVDPNQFKKVEVPIIVVGEVSGMLYLNSEDKLKGLGLLTVQIFNDKNIKVAETLSESDGYFTYLGLNPGSYTIRLDDEQLEKLKYQSTPRMHSVVIKVSEEGTIVEGLDFQVMAKVAKQVTQIIDVVVPETLLQPVKKILLDTITPTPFNNVTDAKDLFYSIKVGVYKDHIMPKKLVNLDTVFYEDLADGTVQYYYGFFRTLERAIIAKNTLVFRGILNTSVVTYQYGKKVPEPTSVNQKDGKPKEDLISNVKEDQINTKKNTSFGRIFDNKEDFFSVQIGVFKNYVPSERLWDFEPVYYELIEGDLIRYISGKFKTYGEAKKMKYKINKQGVKDAFIVKYRDGLRYNSNKN